jgi:hypothetical protein
MSFFYIIFTSKYTHGVSAVPPESPCIFYDTLRLFFLFIMYFEILSSTVNTFLDAAQFPPFNYIPIFLVLLEVLGTITTGSL